MMAWAMTPYTSSAPLTLAHLPLALTYLGGDAVDELGAAAHAWEARVLVVLVHLEWLGLGLRVGLGFSLFSSTYSRVVRVGLRGRVRVLVVLVHLVVRVRVRCWG